MREHKQYYRPLWDSFQDPPSRKCTGSEAPWTKLSFLLKLFKMLTYVFVSITVLVTATTSRLFYILMVAQASKGAKVKYCNIIQPDSTIWVQTATDDEIAWLWGIIFAFAAPEVLTFLRALRMCTFKHVKSPSLLEAVLLASFELLHVIGLATFTFSVLVDLDSGRASMLCNCMSFIPALLNVFNKTNMGWKSIALCSTSIMALIAQASAFVVWPAMADSISSKLLFISLILISARWWENFASSCLKIAYFRKILRTRSRYHTYLYLSPLKVLIFSLTSFALKGHQLSVYFTEFYKGWSIQDVIVEKNASLIRNFTKPQRIDLRVNSNPYILICTPLMQILSSYLCYIFAKFACKIQIQRFSFSVPLCLAGPVSVAATFFLAGIREFNPCIFHGLIPDYMALRSVGLFDLPGSISKCVPWIWIFWWLSQLWITSYIWYPKNDRNSPTEKIFVCPWYCGILVDQCILMNRRRVDWSLNMKHTAPVLIASGKEVTVPDTDKIPQLIVCATMWHETQEEMMGLLKSIIRLDEDQCARRMARIHINGGERDAEYYDLETNIFFDDAFILEETLCTNPKNPPLNEYVKILITSIEKAALEVYGVDLKIKPPLKIETPYGGRLVWTLPGRSKMVVHLKNKHKIRHKKRWSQVMYMYYLLGFRLMELENLTVSRKSFIADNTFLLALDGDIDFQPQAVHLLIDRMKAVDELGAACGRIHPVGRGPMVWYQVFEYAIGHWLQKATEHVIGCVLCSPGCFSLYRGSALMENSVMKKYTTVSRVPMHYVQYDQGEDRWLCTLILRQGLRVEYCAASDAYTHSPEAFSEFYNQRRRWVPSTIANIVDLLSDANKLVRNNSSISMPYVAYQGMLMVGTLLGPGTIFLVMMGALVTVFGIGIWPAFLWNFFPVMFFMLSCIYLKQKYQLLLAFVISTLYCLVMMAVLVGIIIQILDDGPLAPASLFFILIFLQIFLAGVMHPQEMGALIYGFIYYITIPSMYMLLLIYSVFNMNDVSWGTREVAQKESDDCFPPDSVEENREYPLGWMNDQLLVDSELAEITLREKGFWKDFIAAYLKPLFYTKEKKAEIAESLLELRNLLAFSFVMMNAIFVLVVFLLQLKKDYLHLEWPIDPIDHITYDDLNSQVYIYRKYKELDPIGLCFVLFFGMILIIQFIAMFFHRFATFSHLLATTQLNWFRTTTAFTNEDAAQEVRGNAVNIARQLQRPICFDEDVATNGSEYQNEDTWVRRHTVYRLHRNRERPQLDYGDLPTNFERRFFSEGDIQVKNISMSRKSFLLLNETRFQARHRLTEQLHRNADFIKYPTNAYDNPGFDSGNGW